jgi:hypothetical protein
MSCTVDLMAVAIDAKINIGHFLAIFPELES